eukprot:TRINITY_DN12717_c0_g1_i1.p1 TRINITY_DN12717_c0_g1~~TRINITY_DN12717_c0_g1_i1.p1  ORF type:complete len:332 (+),score=86.05 TRINITY_DN12717_c0_g1_i1:137-997(+)
MANEAMGAGDVSKASRLYTLAIDTLAQGLKRDTNGVAADADLLALDKSSEGLLSKLLSNRSMAFLKQGDFAAAVEDADTCTRADPAFEKGHMRLLAALEASGAPLRQQLEAAERGVAVCVHGEMLVKRKWQLKKAIAELGDVPGHVTGEADESLVESTRRIANDPSHPRHAAAASDLGSVLAVGAHGVAKDVKEAERYLRIGSEGGDVAAQRNLGILLIELQRPGDASIELSKAAAVGDEEAIKLMERLASEATTQKAEARAKLEMMAERGDPRAKEILAELEGDD